MEIPTKISSEDFRVVVAIDFGTTCSGRNAFLEVFNSFAYSHRINPDVMVHNSFPGQIAPKTNTVLQYDSDWKVNAWGFAALAKEPSRRERRPIDHPPVELFKLHLADMSEEKKPKMPIGLNFRTAITDFLSEMQKLIKETLEKRWPSVTFPQVRFVFTVPAEWAPGTKGILRDCILKANFLATKNATNLEFTSEPEAAAIFCMRVLKEHQLDVGASFMVCDCGGGTVDLTTRKLLAENQLGEITERTGDLCGSTYVDTEFILFLGRRLGIEAVKHFKEKHYGQYQYLIHKFFCQRVKFEFHDDSSTFRPIELDIERFCPALKQCIATNVKEQMEEDEWIIELQFEDIKAMFDPVVDKIIRLIRNQINANREDKCSAIFVVGGFAESPYLITRLKTIFNLEVNVIAVPQNPITAVLRGAVYYGLDKTVVESRVLKYTYGIQISTVWKEGVDPNKRKTPEGRILKFDRLVARGVTAPADKKFSGIYYPVRADQRFINFKIFYTPKQNGYYCDDPEMKLVGEMTISLPNVHLGLKRAVEFGLTFNEEEIRATAWDKEADDVIPAYFNYEDSA
ncbi:hypothetical protein G9A89_019178 [Geosiphon pyriformis]|nr:hypothetical protein G9A89_019178 [Geosiphon pyriformis]